METIKQYSRTQNSVYNVLTSIGGQILIMVLRFITRTVFIHTLGKAYLGINGLFSDILSMLSLTELGIDVAITALLYKPIADRDDQRVRVLLKFYKLAYRIIGIIIFVLGITLIPFLPKLIRDYESLADLGINATFIYLLYLLQSVLSYLLFAYYSTVMQAAQKSYLLNIANYFIEIITNAVKILVLVVISDFVVYTFVALLAVVIKNIVYAVIAKHYFPQYFAKEQSSLSKNEIIDLLKDCGAVFLYKLNNVVLKATDNIVLSSFIGLTIVGVYSNYLLLFTALKTLLERLYGSVKASMGNLFYTESEEKKYRFFQIMNYLTIILYGTAMVGISSCADEFIRLWVSEDYILPQPFSILIGVELLFYGLQINLGQIRNISGVFRQMWYRPLIGSIINIVVSVELVHVWGIYGVIIGTLVAMLLTNFMIDPYIIHKYSFHNYQPVSVYYKKNIIYILILVPLCTVCIWLCRLFFVGHGWLSFAVHALIVSIIVPTAYMLLFWNSHECRYLVNLINRMSKKVLHKL